MYALGKLDINNPGNIEKTKSGTPWQGEYACSEKRFACFNEIGYGYRAMFVLLRNYIVGGANTITKIINKWAPPVENDTNGYVNFVANNSGINANKVIDKNDLDSLTKIVSAMARMENGVAAKPNEVAAGRELAKNRFDVYVKAGGIGLGVIIIGGIIWYLAANKKL